VIIVLAWGMRNGDDFSVEQTQGEESLFTVRLAGIFGRDRVPGEDDLDVYEVDAVFVEVFLAFGLVPGEHAGKCSYITQLRQAASSGL